MAIIHKSVLFKLKENHFEQTFLFSGLLYMFDFNVAFIPEHKDIQGHNRLKLELSVVFISSSNGQKKLLTEDKLAKLEDTIIFLAEFIPLIFISGPTANYQQC